MYKILTLVFFLSLSICQDLIIQTTQEISKTETDSLSILKDEIIEEANLEANKIINEANQILDKAVEKEEKAKNLINKAEKEADSIIHNASKTSTSIIATAKDSASTIINESEKKAIDIIANSNKKANKTISEAKLSADQQMKKAQKEVDDAKNEVNEIINSFNKRQAFIDSNAILALSILSLIIISSFSFVFYRILIWRKKINNNSIELPEIVREDIDNISQKLKNLSTKDDEQITKNEILELVTKLKDALPNFGRAINETVLELDKKADKNYNEALKLLREQLELKEDIINQKSSLKIQKKYISEVLEIKKRILFLKHSQSDKKEDIYDIVIDKIESFLKNEGVLLLSFEKGYPLEEMLPFEFEKVESVQTDNNSLDQTVCETIEVGYFVKISNNKKEVILPAKVSIYVPIQESDDIK